MSDTSNTRDSIYLEVEARRLKQIHDGVTFSALWAPWDGKMMRDKLISRIARDVAYLEDLDAA